MDLADDSPTKVKPPIPKTQSKLNFGPKSEPRSNPVKSVAAPYLCTDKPVSYSTKVETVKDTVIEPVAFDYVDSYDETCAEPLLDEKQGEAFLNKTGFDFEGPGIPQVGILYCATIQS